MKNMNLKVFKILVAGILFLGSNQLMAQHEKKMENYPKGKDICCTIPDLTEAQQKKIDELKLAHQKNMLQLKNQLAEKETHLQTLRTADKPDMDAINKTVDEIGAIHTQMMKEKESHIQQVRAQLTDSQRIQFDLHQNKGAHKGYGREMGCYEGKEKGKRCEPK
jgi:Spy/CpxP family protein refolding chaperone